MLAFARETQLSETTFIQTATEAGADYRNRIWTIVGELPLRRPSVAGHGGRPCPRARRARGALRAADGGRAAARGRRAGRQRRRARLDAPAACRLRRRGRPRWVLGALGLDAADGHPELPPQVVSTGVAQLMVPVREAAVLARVRPDAARSATCCASSGSSASISPPTIPPAAPPRPAATSRPTGDRRGPRHRLRRRAAVRLPARPHGRRARRRSSRATRWAGRAACMCEAGERVRVAGDVVLLADGEIEL